MAHPLPKVTWLYKRKITRCNVTVSNVLWMTVNDESWRDLEGGHQRLRWARKRWQAVSGSSGGTAKDAADSLGMKDGTYRAYERPPEASKHTPLDDQAAIRFARKFKVSWTWLLTGEGSPYDEQVTPQMERAIKAMAALSDEAQKAIADMAEAFAATRTGTKG